MTTPQIRNFSIVAHIDHGKSTLADRLLQATRAVSDREAREQMLDSMDLERERGITIKASAVTVAHEHLGPEGPVPFMLNFIDTPGHVDFSYEVSRALKACEGALLVVDASQGVEAQTVVNAYLAIEQDLEIIPVLNKIDLPGARPDEIAEEVEQVLGLPAEDCIPVSAKTGQGVPELLAAICERLPPPRAPVTAKTRARVLSAIPPASYGNRVLLLDPHSEGIPHYFEGGTVAVHVHGRPILTPLIQRLGGDDFVLGSTDAGRAKWVQTLANELGVTSAFVIKRRLSGTRTEISAIGAEVTGRAVVVYDDMIRTGGSLLDAARAYRDAGASRVSAVCTHAVLPGDALDRLHDSGLFDAIAATDSHPRARQLEGDRLEVISVAELFEPLLTR